jgi:hypothetical protein
MSRRLCLFFFISALANAADVCRGIAPAVHLQTSFPDSRPAIGVPATTTTLSRSFRLSVKAGGPEFLITVRAFPLTGDSNVLVRAGEIEIAHCQDGQRSQLLPIMASQAIGFADTFRVYDIDFDGYLDISVLAEFGATFGSQSWWVYDPAGGKFVQNQLTRELRQVDSNGYTIDPKKHEITANHLMAGCPPVVTRYRIEKTRLLMIHQEIVQQQTPCTVTFLDRVGGTMKVTAKRRLSADKPLQ